MFDHSEVAEQSASLGRSQIPDEARVDAFRAIVAQTLPAKVVSRCGVALVPSSPQPPDLNYGHPYHPSPEHEPQRLRQLSVNTAQPQRLTAIIFEPNS